MQDWQTFMKIITWALKITSFFAAIEVIVIILVMTFMGLAVVQDREVHILDPKDGAKDRDMKMIPSKAALTTSMTIRAMIGKMALAEVLLA